MTILPENFINQICKGNRRALAKAITLVESKTAPDKLQAAELLRQLSEKQTHAVRLSISGPPGAGKSTLIESMGLALIDRGLRVAVLAVDPSSSLAKGAILGDKTRMEKLSRCDKAFVRPSSSGAGFLGGINPAADMSMRILEAAQFDVILIETIGVGQNEVAVHAVSDLMLLVLSPAAGDDLQGVKKGIVELADCIVINKADGDLYALAKSMASDYHQSASFLKPTDTDVAPVLCCSALTGDGVDHLINVLLKKTADLKQSGQFQERRRAKQKIVFEQATQYQLLQYFEENPAVQQQQSFFQEQIILGKITMQGAIQQLLDLFFQSQSDSIKHVVEQGERK